MVHGRQTGKQAGGVASASPVELPPDVLVGDRQDIVENGNTLLGLVLGDGQWRHDHDHVPVRHQVETLLERRLREPGDGRGRFTGPVVGNEHLPGRSVLDELETPEAALAAHVAE